MVDQVQWNHQSADAAVAIEKRVDGFKLVVADANPDQMRHYDFLVVPEFLQITHQVWNGVMMGWDKCGILQAGTSDPVLAVAKLTGQLVLSAYTPHKNFMSVF